jgi:tetratricopeptide (TPR) repeat protein
MRRVAAVLLLALAAPAVAQDFPKPTEAGRKALDDLIRRCVAAGGLRASRGEPAPLVVVDPAQLRAAVVADRAALTPALRDALIDRWAEVAPAQEPGTVALLRTLGEATDDRLALAFATFFEAKREETRNPASSIRSYAEAARRFAGAGERAWEAACFNDLASVHQAQGAYAEALEIHQKALDIKRMVYGDRHPRLATSYNNIAGVHLKLGEDAEALEGFRKALEIQLAAYGEQHPDVATSYNNIAGVYHHQGEHARALEGYQKALGIRRAAYGEQHPDVAASYNNIASVHAAQGKFTEALAGNRKALGIWRAAYGERHPAVATSLNNIAGVYQKQGEYSRALNNYQASLEILLAVFGERHPDVATIYANIASVHERQGQYAQALEGFEKALAIRRPLFGERNLSVATCYHNIAFICYKRSEHARALEGFRKTIDVQRALYGERHPQVAACYNSIGLVYLDQGEDGQAMEYFRKALDIHRSVQGEQHPSVARCYSNIGVTYNGRGEYDKALEAHRKALDIRRAVYGETHSEVAESYHNIAAVYDSQGEYDLALEGYRKALDVFREEYGERHPAVAASYNNIANVYARQGEYVKALEGFTKALEIKRVVYGEQHPDVGTGYYNLAGNYGDLGEYPKALDALDRALNALRIPDDPAAPAPVDDRARPRLRPLPMTVDVLRERGEIREENLRPDSRDGLRACLRDYEAAIDVLQQLRQRVLLTDPSKLRLGEQFSELFPRTIGITDRLAALERAPAGRLAALSAAERGSARVFLEGLGRARAQVVGHVDAGLRSDELSGLAQISELDGRIDQALAQPFESRDPAAVRRLFDERQQAEERLQALIARMEHDYPQYTALKYPKACAVEEARDCLGTDEVALLYVLGSEASYLIVLAKDADPQTAGITIHRLPPAGEIVELMVGLMRPTILNDNDSTRELGRRAYRMILGPAAASIRGKGLVIVPGGVLGLLPFELLVEPTPGAKDDAGGNGRFLVEGHHIRYAPSLTTLHFVQQWDQTRTRPERVLWAMGDPVYQPTDKRLAAQVELDPETIDSVAKYSGGGGRGKSFERLPSSGMEIEQLRRLWDAAPEEVLVGPAATEAAVKVASASDTLAKYRYVHFAIHGILKLDDAIQPSLVLSLAGDQHGEDGFLRLDEVTSLRLNADLVVLSACQTGQGELYSAEGVSGLARAFLYAGSRAVLCSLWRVDDEATVGLMTDIYAGLKAQKPAADALREAQLRMIADGQPPLYWAPFILIGQ